MLKEIINDDNWKFSKLAQTKEYAFCESPCVSLCDDVNVFFLGIRGKLW